MDNECLVAADGDEAWRVFQASGADVIIISDRLMPGLDGLELCRRVREHPGAPYTYFVFLTALTHRSEILEGMHEGADDYLTKPLDLDRFKAYNDLLGHLEGDHALCTVATLLKEAIRDTDSVYRYGGEELLVVLPEQTLDSAALAGERLRRAVAAAGLAHPHNQPHGIVTLSIGIAAYEGARVGDFEAVIAEPDAALYEAKHSGRNRVAIARARHRLTEWAVGGGQQTVTNHCPLPSAYSFGEQLHQPRHVDEVYP